MKDEIKEILDSLKDILDEPKGLDEMPNGNLYEYDRSYDLEQDEIKVLLDYITNLQTIEQQYSAILSENAELENKITNLQEENKELKMTNLALADDITKNKIIKQEVLTECCGIPIGEIPMLKIQNDEYKQRIDKATEYINKHFHWGINGNDNIDDLLNILQGSDE